MGGKRNYLFGQPTINPLEQKAFRLSGYRAGLRISLLCVVMSAGLKKKNVIFVKFFLNFLVQIGTRRPRLSRLCKIVTEAPCGGSFSQKIESANPAQLS